MTYLVCFSGTPGTGKTTLAKKLYHNLKENKLTNVLYVDHNYLVKKFPKVKVGYDKIKDSVIINEKKLNDIFKEIINLNDKEIIIFDSHLSHYIKPELVDLLFITKTDISTLKKRLKSRNYNPNKIRENLDCEIFDVCNIDSKEFNHNPYIINTNTSIKNSYNKINEIINKKLFD